jgi:hypothetical protein
MTVAAEYFASFCLAQDGDASSEIEALDRLGKSCDECLRYWEIVYVAAESSRQSILAATGSLARARNLRVVLVNDDASYYRRRLVAASEAIGDVVTLTSLGELQDVDPIEFAAQAIATDQIVIARRSGSPRVFPLAHWLLSTISRYRVSPQDLRTIALPRSRLVALLARPTASIDLRFEAKRGGMQFVRRAVVMHTAREKSSLMHRFELAAELLSTSAARFLKAYSVLSLLGFLLAGAYGLYAVAVIFMKANVQPGWFSTAIAQSGSVSFLALGSAIFSLGLSRVAERMEASVQQTIIDEIGNTSAFNHIGRLNVEVESPDVEAGAPSLEAGRRYSASVT